MPRPAWSAFVEGLDGDVVELFGSDVLARIEIPPTGDNPDAERRELAGTLAASAGGDREPLERLRSHFIRRLHRFSDDFGATAGLRVTETALMLTPHPLGVWAWGHREPVRPKRRWWRRRHQRTR